MYSRKVQLRQSSAALNTIVAGLQAAAAKADDVRPDAINDDDAAHVVLLMAASIRKLNRLLASAASSCVAGPPWRSCVCPLVRPIKQPMSDKHTPGSAQGIALSLLQSAAAGAPPPHPRPRLRDGQVVITAHVVTEGLAPNLQGCMEMTCRGAADESSPTRGRAHGDQLP